jgi:hypothetical protein
MKLIGYWMESLKDVRLPLPQELVGEMPDSVRDAVCAYLASGQPDSPFFREMGCSWCRFLCGIESRHMGSKTLNDGEWMWPEGLVHYVRKHSVVLPEEFIATATSARAPLIANEDRGSIDFWVEWAAKRRCPSLREQLAEALDAARAAEPAYIESQIQDHAERILQKEKESSATCIFAGCLNHALAGRRICARHMAAASDYEGDYGLPPMLLCDSKLWSVKHSPAQR